MKPFNLQAALAGEAVVTRNGCTARILCFDLRNKFYPLAVAVYNPDSDEEDLFSYGVTGSYYQDQEHNRDLFMAPVKREGWVNVYQRRDMSHYVGSGIYPSEVDAKAASNKWECYIGTTHIEWEE